MRVSNRLGAGLIFCVIVPLALSQITCAIGASDSIDTSGGAGPNERPATHAPSRANGASDDRNRTESPEGGSGGAAPVNGADDDNHDAEAPAADAEAPAADAEPVVPVPDAGDNADDSGATVVEPGNPEPPPPMPVDAGDTVGPGAASHPVADCLRISGYLEGGGNVKALAIFNCGEKAVEMANYGLCLETNSATDCSVIGVFEGVVTKGDVLVLVGPDYPLPTTHLKSPLANFTGDDRIALFRDVNGDESLTRGVDEIIDSIGTLGVRPTPSAWARMGLRRKNCTPFLGVGPFDYRNYYERYPATDTTQIALAPQIQCPR